MALSNGDVLKIDEATKIGIHKSFTYLSYLKDQEKLKK